MLITTEVCRSVADITLGISSQDNMWVIRQTDEGPELMNESNLKHLAEIEGFDSVEEMKQWFTDNHKLQPGIGIDCEQIKW